MGKITGLESLKDVPPKVLLMYEAVEQLILEGADINDIRVSAITDRAGIGKGTAYDYFDTKEDILVCAVIFSMRKVVDELKSALLTKNSFAEVIAYLLDAIEKGRDKQQCITRYIHVMTDQSGFSRMVHDKLAAEEAKDYHPRSLFAGIIEEGIERGEVRNDLPIDYIVYTLFSKIISYILWFREECFAGFNTAEIRPLVYKSILDELCQKNV